MTRTIFGLFMVLGAFVALQWHDNYTEARIARAGGPRSYECGDIVVPAQREVIVAEAAR